MALYLNQNETHSRLSTKVSARLQERLNKRAPNPGVEEAVLLQNQRKTTNGGLFWTIVLTFVVICLVVYVVFFA